MSRKRRPRDAAEALALLKQFASETRDNQEKLFKAFRPVAKTARHAVPVWIEPLPRRIAPSHLMIADAVEAYTLEQPTRRNPRARSMDVALGLKRPAGAGKGHAEGWPANRNPHSLPPALGRNLDGDC